METTFKEPPSTSKGVDDKELVANVQARLEALFSTKSLAEDAILKQHMNAQTYIPLAALTGHPSFHDLLEKCDLHAVLKAAAERSDKMSVNEDGKMIRPLLKAKRNTLILRDLPDSPEDELRALFASSPESDAFVSLKPDVNNTAFASFKSEEAAQNVALWLRSQKLRGSEIKCAVKSEHLVRSFVPASPGPSLQASPYMMPQVRTYPVWVPGKEWGDPGNWEYQTEPVGDSAKGKGHAKGVPFEPLPPAEVPQNVAKMPPTPLLRPQEPETFENFAYTGHFRKYSRQQIVDLCSAMEEIAKPDTYKNEEEKNGLALFRLSPCRDWAPLPSPDTLLRESDLQEPGSRKSSWASDAKRRSRSQSMDPDESAWARGDSYWWKPTAKPTSKWVAKGKGPESADRAQKWIEKGRLGVEASPTMAPSKAPASPPSWADKVRLGSK